MPKVEIDYSNTIIYKITCKESLITDLYVGHTTNFVQRKHAHKQSCSNIKSNNYNCKLYKVIRENGGWQNWSMEIVNFFNCYDHYEARKKEQEYFLSLNATLNSIEPMPKPKDKNITNTIDTNTTIDKVIKPKPKCDVCNKKFDNVKLYDIHINTNKHKKMLKNNNFSIKDLFPKISKEYICESCDYKCSKNSEWNKHSLTLKHKNRTNLNNLTSEISCSKKFNCKKCFKEYNARNSLWYHEQKCIVHDKVVNVEKDDNKLINIVLDVVKSNTELQKQNDEFKSLIIEQNKSMIEQNKTMIETVQEVCKNNNTNIVNTNNVNSHNKAFNLNVFLNETCKDAMDVNDFIDSFKLQLSDLDLVGKLGFVDGISSIIIKNLKALKVSERPVHCTDTKRETIYVKDQGIWEKQEDDHKKLRKIIKRVAFKNSKNLSLYKELHPDCTDYYSKHNDHYLNLRIEAFGGSGNETVDNENKIIKKIIKEMTIDKK
jgi:hypothetical protein